MVVNVWRGPPALVPGTMVEYFSNPPQSPIFPGGVDISPSAPRIQQYVTIRDSVALGITAHAGGGRENATQLDHALNRIDYCATAGDSVALPGATLVGAVTVVDNNTHRSVTAFPSLSNAATGASDAMVALGSIEPVASVDVLPGIALTFVCLQLGTWKQEATGL